MEQPDLLQSIWQRGWLDSKRAVHSIWFWVLETFGGAIIGALFQNAWYVVVALVCGFAVLFVAATARVPFLQRNESRDFATCQIELNNEMAGKLKDVHDIERGLDALSEFLVSGNESLLNKAVGDLRKPIAGANFVTR